ncbi:MAG TPA: hypothetical protein PK177_20510, partial [Burkholderiaceae bacterium]|nr:hypothetical protein [Burkholderiaceae bacterium]
ERGKDMAAGDKPAGGAPAVDSRAGAARELPRIEGARRELGRALEDEPPGDELLAGPGRHKATGELQESARDDGYDATGDSDPKARRPGRQAVK